MRFFFKDQTGSRIRVEHKHVDRLIIKTIKNPGSDTKFNKRQQTKDLKHKRK
jgi:hypothetical protein